MSDKISLTQAAFAEQQGWARSYVTQLKQAGRLVMSEDGRRVDVAASLARIEATRSPDKAGVADMHAQGRGHGNGNGNGGSGDGTAGALDDEPVDRRDYQDARARREAANATLAEIDVAERAGALMEADQVEAALADAVTTLRTSLEGMGALLAPQLAAESNEFEIRQLVDDHVHAALQSVANRFAEMARMEVHA